MVRFYCLKVASVLCQSNADFEYGMSTQIETPNRTFGPDHSQNPQYCNVGRNEWQTKRLPFVFISPNNFCLCLQISMNVLAILVKMAALVQT